MKRSFTLLLSFSLLCFSQITYSQTTADPQATVYASIASGAWNGTTTWETYSTYAAAIAASPGSGTAYTGTTGPSGTHNVLIRSGHTVTMGAANRGCKSIIIQAGGKLWANEAIPTARRLQIGQGGTNFSYPLTDTVQIDGTLGGANDALYIEGGTAAKYINISGSGAIDIGRIRTIGGSGASAGGVLVLNIDANVNCWVTSNYGLSIVYNPTTTDNYTCNIKPGKTVALKTATTAFHNSQNATTYGTYVYNIQGVLDFTANSSSSIIAPAPATSKITMNIDGGTVKSGASFRADTTITNGSTTYTSQGILDVHLTNSGVFDATVTTNFKVGKTTDGAGGVKELVFDADANSSILATVGSTQVKFPLGIGTSPNNVYLTNTGTSDVYTTKVKTSIDNTPPQPTKVVNRQWTINETVAGGSITTVGLSWITADQAAGFNPSDAVVVLRWNGTAYEPYAATVSGSGTVNDPYIATTTSAVTSFSPFIVANAGTPAPVNFINAKAYSKGNGIQVEWTTAQESDLNAYIIERSADGRSFSNAGTVAPNNSASNTYSWFDASPLAGTNYYRIKSVDYDGKAKYTSILRVTTGKGKSDIIVSPNPVVGLQASLQLVELSKGLYTVRVYNSGGQTVYSTSVSHAGGSSVSSLQLPKNLSNGIYSIEVAGNDTQLKKMIVIQ